MKINKFGIGLVITIFCMGCATTSTIRHAKGTGKSEVFNYPYGRVFDSAVDAIRDHTMEIIEKDRTSGTIIAKKGISAWSWGERVGVYFYKIDEAHTKVEVISKLVSELDRPFGAKNWTDTIFLEMQKNLEKK